MRFNTKEITVTRIAPRNAERKPSMTNPSTTTEVIQSNTLFNTRRKRPKVRTVIGRVKTTRIGLTIALSIARTSAAAPRARAVLKLPSPSILMPGMIAAVNPRAKKQTMNRIRNPDMISPYETEGADTYTSVAQPPVQVSSKALVIRLLRQPLQILYRTVHDLANSATIRLFSHLPGRVGEGGSMRRANRSCMPHIALILVAIVCTPQIATAISGQIVVDLEGAFFGSAPPSVVLQGADRQESVLLGALVISTGEIRFTDLPTGTYRLSLEGGATLQDDPMRSVEVGVHPGSTTLVRLDMETNHLRIEPFRPDPFGVDESWDAGWLEMLPGGGEQAALAAFTSPDIPRHATIEGLDVAGSGFNHRIQLRGESIARSEAMPIGPVSAAYDAATRSVLARTQDTYADFEAATGYAGQTSWEATGVHRFTNEWGKPRVFFSIRGLDYLDAAPSVFETDRLPHSGMEGLDLLTRVDVDLSENTKLGGILYGEGEAQKYNLKSFRDNPRHGPREERAAMQGALRMTHDWNDANRLLLEASMQRTFIESGDGTYFDNLKGYPGNAPGSDDSGLYWHADHPYDYFNRKVNLDLTGRFETWRNPGTDRSTGIGISVRRGTYRSYEHLKPTNVWLGEPGGYRLAQSIGYDTTGVEHGDTDGMKPGHPLTVNAFLTTRRPIAGGQIEFGVRGTHYRPGQQPLRSLFDPLGDNETLDPDDFDDEPTTTTIDPRIAYTRRLGDRLRVWLAGGSETRLPPSAAVYFSDTFLNNAALVALLGDDSPQIVFGNPALEPERAWNGIAGIGAAVLPTLSVRVGVEGETISDAITPRVYSVGEGSLAYYINDGTRDLVDVSLRADFEPTPRARFRASYDLSKMRTETVEPSLLDAVWLYGNLPTRAIDSREGLLPVLPAFDDGVDRGFYPSLYDRRHRFSIAAALRPPADLLGEAGELILTNLDIGILFRFSSGRPYTLTYSYQAGSLDEGEPLPDPRDPSSYNSERADWIGQLDIRVGRTIGFFGLEGQLWMEILNLTDRENAINVYQASGLGDDDGWLKDSFAGPALAQAYRERIRDHNNYGDPLLLHAGLRLRLP